MLNSRLRSSASISMVPSKPKPMTTYSTVSTTNPPVESARMAWSNSGMRSSQVRQTAPSSGWSWGSRAATARWLVGSSGDKTTEVHSP